MNNDQNNIFGNVTPIQPTNSNQNNTTSNEVSQNQPSTTNQGIIHITPISEVQEENSPNIEQPQITPTLESNNAEQPLHQGIAPTIIMPATKEETTAQPSPQPLNKELKLESASPFDIGVNAPLSTNTNINIPQSAPNNIPITPINVSNNVQENTTSDINLSNNQQQNQDINIPSQENLTLNNNTVSVGKYLLYIILFSIPIVGLIMLIIKALDKKDKNISNFAKAQLLIMVIAIALSFVLFFIAGASIANTIINKQNDISTYQTTDYDY